MSVETDQIEIWRKKRVLNVVGMGNSWLYEAMKRDEFPRPIKLGTRAVGWRKSDVIAWLESREAKGSDT